MEISLLSDISRAIYAWVLNANAPDFTYLQNAVSGGYGMQWAFITMLLVSVIGVCCYYFGIASQAVKATKQNYIVVFILSLLTMWVLDYVIIYAVAGMDDPLTWNMLKLNLVNSVYFAFMYEIWSWFLKGGSKAPNIDLLTCWS